MLQFAPAHPSAPGIADLIEAHHTASRRHYALEDCHAFDGATLVEGGVTLHAAWRDGVALGIGGLKPLGGGAVELKSMHTAAAARGQGVASALLRHLMDVARGQGHRRMLLEAGRTDAYAAPARALYARHGFRACPPFGDYVARDASIFLARDLG